MARTVLLCVITFLLLAGMSNAQPGLGPQEGGICGGVIRNPGAPQVPPIGTTRVLTIFATGPGAAFDTIPWWGRHQGRNGGIWDTTVALSVPSFYEDNSYHQHHVRSDTVLGRNGDSLCILSENDPDFGISSIFWESVFAQVDTMVNLADYDHDNDGYVDQVFLIITGYDGVQSNRGWNCPFYWTSPRTGKIIGLGLGEVTDKRKWVAVGVTCHEYGHSLWLPDMYGNSWEIGGTYGIGQFSTMGRWYSNWEGVDYNPTPIDPWCKTNLGWVTPVEVTQPLYNYPLSDFNTTAQVYAIRPLAGNGGTRQDYFLITNHQRMSYWERTYPGKGLMIFRYPPILGQGSYKPIDLEGAHGKYDWDNGWPYPNCLWTVNDSTGSDSLDKAQCYGKKPENPFDAWGGPKCFWSASTQTIFDGLSSPSTRAEAVYEGKFIQTHAAVYNIHADPVDSTLMRADFLVNNWFGHVTRDTFWGPGHYVITGDVTVDPGVTLTIKPGTKIDFYPHVNNQPSIYSEAGIYVNGKLKAVGKSQPESLIVFRSNAALRGGTPSNNDWRGIYLGHGSTDTLKYCQISDCYYGVWADSAIAVIDSNTIGNNVAYGIRVTNGRRPSSGTGLTAKGPKVMRNRLLQSLGTSPTYGIYLERANNANPNCTTVVWNNYIETANYGIYVLGDSFGTAARGMVQLFGDTIVYPFSMGGLQAGIHLEGTKSAARVHLCRISSGIGNAGIECLNRSWAKMDSTKLISDISEANQRTAYGIYVWNAQSPNLTTVPNITWDSLANFDTGVRAGDMAKPLRMGINGNATFPGFNNLDGIKTYYVNYYHPLYVDSLRAENNWWGSNPPDPAKFFGWIDYLPYRTGRVSQPFSLPGGGSAPQEGELLEALLPTKFELGQSYPNPANRELTIRYALPQEARVSIKVYNVAGQLIRTLVSCPMAAGYHSVRWDGKTDNGHSAGPGVYFYRMDAGTFSSTKKLILAR